MLRESVLVDLKRHLDQPPFVIAQDFSVEAKRGSEGVSVSLTYQVGSGEFFKALIPFQKKKRDAKESFYENAEFEIKCEFNPGELTARELQTLWGLTDLYKGVSAWSRRIAEDLERGPAFRLIQEQAAKLDELEQRIASVPDAYATAEQAAKLETWIGEVEKDLRSRIEQIETDAKKKQAKLDELSAEFHALKQRVHHTKMKSLLRSLAARIFRVSSDPRLGHLIENGSKIAGLLTDEVPKP